MPGQVCCSRCDSAVRLPSQCGDVTVRCPHCKAEFPLSEITDQLPPELEVVTQREAFPGIATKPSGAAVTASDDLSLAPPEIVAPAVESAQGVVLRNPVESQSASLLGDGVAQVPSPQHLHAERKKARAMYGKNSFVKVVLGGVMGLLLGQLVLWWLPGSYRSDPFQLAPKLPAAVSFLAPASLRGPEPLNLGTQPAGAATIDGSDQSALPLTGDDSAGGDLPGAAKSTLTEQSTESTGNQGLTPKTSADVLVGLADAPQLRVTELRETLKTANRAHRAFVTSQSWTPQDISTWYDALCGLAHGVTFADTRDEGIGEFGRDARSSLGRMFKDARRIEVMASHARQRLLDPDQDRNGILVSGVVRDIVVTGELFQTEIELSDGGQELVRVVSRFDPRGKKSYDVNDSVLVLGVIVVDPSLYLLGYQGTAEVVVLGGMPLRLARSSTAQ